MHPTPLRGLLAVSWPFLVAVALLTATAWFSLDTLSAARAFVGGESLWSKAQKRAVQCLERYARDAAPEDRACFEQAMARPLADRQARLELERADPDLDAAERHLVRGGNDPQDVAGMVRLYRRFRQVGPIAEAIRVWAQGDHRLLALQQLGEAVHRHIGAGERDRALALLTAIQAVDGALSPQVNGFSAALGQAARQARGVLMATIVAAAGVLSALSLALTRRLLRRERRIAAVLATSEKRLQLAIAASDHGIWDYDARRHRVHVSPHFMAALGHVDWPEQVGIEAFLGLLHDEDRPRVRAVLTAECGGADRYEMEFRVCTAPQTFRWLQAIGSVIRDARGRQARMAGAISDITERKAAQSALFAVQDRALVTLESIGDAVVTADSEGRVDYLNPVAESLLGQRLAELHGRPIVSVCTFIDEVTRGVLPHPVDAALADGRNGSDRGHARLDPGALLCCHDGGELPVDASAATIRGRDGTLLGTALVLRDVSRERAAAARLSYQATHDSVTGLINRREFERRAGLALAGAHGGGQQHALLYLDLDQFKVVNDTCGHAAGDELLRQVGGVLKARLRAADTLGRLGGDEFGVLLDHCGPEPALRVAEQLRQALADFRYTRGGNSFGIGGSIGLVNLDAHSADLADVLSGADRACYLAKELGRNRVQVYHASDGELALRRGQMQWVAHIQEALDEGRLRLHAQPIVPAAVDDPPSAQPLHAELLLRMVSQDGRLVPPMAFLPAAERFGLMPTLDRWVLRAAFESIARVDPAGRCQFAINLSGASVGDERFLAYVRDETRRCGITPAGVCFEITETAVISNLARASRFIQTLRGDGFRFALDDFGSGMSSFGYLKQLPVDYLKIDGGFVKDMLSDPVDAAMVEAIHRVGRVMGMRTIAEFVENDAVRQRLREIGVDHVQGYGIGRPQPFDELVAAVGLVSVAEPVLSPDT